MPQAGIEQREAFAMTAVLSIALAGAAVVPATAIEPGGWFTSREHPKTALAVAERGHVAYAIDVAPDGTALRCTTREDTELDRKVCDLVMKRARFLPARDAQGTPAFAVHEGIASFLMPGRDRSRPDRAKLVVAADRLPEGVAGPAYARVAFLVDGVGAISHCAASAGERRRFLQTVEALGPAACDALRRDYRPAPARNLAGEPVASVQSAMVRFELRAAR
jgi:hypothetical protein